MTPEQTLVSRQRAFLMRVIVIAAVAASISLVWSVNFRPPGLQFDENYYYPLGEKIAAGTYEDGYVIRAPLYPVFLAGIFKAFGGGFLYALIIQSLLRGLVVAWVAYMGKRYLSEAAGLTAAGLLALYPALISIYMSFLTEVIYIPLFLVSFHLLDRASRSERKADTVKAGVASGLAALARATSFFLTFVLAAWFAVGKSSTGRLSWANIARAALLVAVMFAVISPWTARNAAVHKGFIPIADDSAFNLWLITSGMRIRAAVPEWSSWGGHAERQREAYDRWFAYLREDPTFHIRRLGVVLPRILSPSWESPVRRLSTLETGAEPREVPALARLWGVLHPVMFWLILGGGLAGLLVLEKDGKRRTLVLILVVYFLLIHGMTLARSRFMLPLACLLAIYSGGLISTGIQRLGWTRRARRSP
jgi:4-amino-4-deoxy-L-arabinose transferase-like glycosyltransferase